VDAIVGAAKLMHTVIAGLCTGCDLCVPPCPVDCISMPPAPADMAGWDEARATAARDRYTLRNVRLAREHREREDMLARKSAVQRGSVDEKKRATIQAAIERARVRQSAKRS
jgi:electron transport complex protein RnfB